jgi:hypothetical protein
VHSDSTARWRTPALLKLSEKLWATCSPAIYFEFSMIEQRGGPGDVEQAA